MNGKNKKMLYAVLLFVLTLCFVTACGNSSQKQTQEMKVKDLDGMAEYDYTSKEISCNIGSQSDGKTTEMSIMTEADDLNAVINCTREWDFVDSEKIVLLGGSQGGAVAAVTAARSEDEIAGLVLLYPAFVAYDEVHAQFDSLEEVPDKFNFLGWIRVGKNYVSDIWDYDNYGEMKNYKKPVLLIHGDRDSTVDVSYSERAAESYPDATLHVIKGAGHGFYGGSFEEAMQYIFSYLMEIGMLE